MIDPQEFEDSDEISGQLRLVLTELKERARDNPDGFFNLGRETVCVKKLVDGREIDWPQTERYPLERRCYNFLIGVYPMKYLPNSFETQRLIANLTRQDRQDYLRGLLEAIPSVGVGIQPGWLFVKSKEAVLKERSSEKGRLYINVPPQQTHRVFYELAKFLGNHPDLPFDLKTMLATDGLDVVDLNRADKIVLYFDASHQEQILAAIRDFYQRINPQVFEDNTPKLAAQLKDGHGGVMRGIAFGQEPDPEMGRATFNNLREGVFLTLHQQGVSVDDPNYDKRVIEAFKQNMIDPQNPAFNWPPEKGKKLFSVIAANTV